MSTPMLFNPEYFVVITDYETLRNRTIHNNLRVREFLRESTAHIDFACEFDEHGTCKNYRGNAEPTCCCSNCFKKFGYQDGSCCLEKDVETYISLFKPGVGFWVAGQGCALPRRLRSNICVFYNCIYDEELCRTLDALHTYADRLTRDTIDAVAMVLGEEYLWRTRSVKEVTKS